MGNLVLGLAQLTDPAVFLALFTGVLLGLTVGALPGLNDSITIAVLIPVTFGMQPSIAIALLVGIYVSSACGGSIPAILLEIPGTASAVVTAYDGYQLRKKGHGLEALSVCMTSSVFGGLVQRSGIDFPFAGIGFCRAEVWTSGVFYAGRAGTGYGCGHGGQELLETLFIYAVRPVAFLHRNQHGHRLKPLYVWKHEFDGRYSAGPAYDWLIWYSVGD